MTREQLEALQQREIHPPCAVEDLIDFLKNRLDLKPVAISKISKMYFEMLQQNVYHSYRNQELGLMPDAFHFSVFEVVPNEKSRLFYRMFYASDRMGVVFEHKTGWCLANCDLLTTVLFILQGISEKDVEQKNWIYQWYDSLFDSLEEELQELDELEESEPQV